MKVAVVGSRTFHDYALLASILDESLTAGDVIVSGNCPIGADFFAEEYARFTNTPIILLKPERLTGTDFFARNKDIAEESDVCIAFWDGKSAGTHDTIKHFQRQGKPVKIVFFKPFYAEEKNHSGFV